MRLSVRTSMAIAIVGAFALGDSSSRVFGDDIGKDYVKQLRTRGYTDWAIEFLKIRQANKRLPEDLAETIELELAECYRTQAEESTSVDASERKLDLARELLEKFLKEKPKSEANAAARAGLADVDTQRGRLLIRLAKATADARLQSAQFEKARANLLQARGEFAKVVAECDRELADNAAEREADAPAKKPAKRASKSARRDRAGDRAERLEADRVEAQFKLAQSDYLAAQTFADVKNPERLKLLASAAAGFDNVHQRYRTAEIGLYAHMWHGKAEDERGNLQGALDIYDEVLVNAPDAGQKSRFVGFEALFAQVEYFRLLVVARQGKSGKFETEAADWIKKNRAARATAGYQGIAVEFAKSLLKLDENLDAGQRRKRAAEGLRFLEDAAKTASEHQSEAILLVRKHRSQSSGNPKELATFDEAVAVGESAVADGQSNVAFEAFSRALELSEKVADRQRVDRVRVQRATVRIALGQLEDAFADATELAKADAKSPSAAPAASVAVSAALAIFGKSPNAKSMQQLKELAEFTIATWPDRAEADDARIALGRAQAFAGQLNEAAVLFEKVDPKSPRHALALQLAGQSFWRQYLLERNKPEASRSPSLLSESRLSAEQRTRQSLEIVRQSRRPDEPMSRTEMETQLLLGEILLDAGKSKDAIALMQPLTTSIAGIADATVDPMNLRTLAAAFRAMLAIGDIEGAAKMRDIALTSNDANVAANAVLIQMAGQLQTEWQKSTAAKDRIKAVQIVLLDRLAKRKELPLTQAIFVGDCYSAFADDVKARDVYLQVLERAKTAKSAGDSQYLPRVRSQLVGLLRKEGKFDLALQQAEELIRLNPRALEPLLEKGRILMAWSEKDPSHLADGVQHFTMLRTLLARMQNRPPEYFEAVYGAAFCLAAQSRQTGDSQKKTQAIQLLKSTMILSPNLSGPAMQEKFRSLLQSLQSAS